ncbi:MAG: ABC transporter permease [Candidatus Omnitrophica bacterium]|nr:ABC transporter permease [Candidatus Omnitrophota bacterium]
MFLHKIWAIFKRDLTENLSYKSSFFFDLAGILASMLTFFFIAQLFGPQASPYLEKYGGDYFPFVLIGLAMAGYQMTGLNSFAGALSREIHDGTLEAILITPTSLNTLVLSGALWSFLSTSVRLIIYLVLGIFLFNVDISGMNAEAAVISIFLTITSLAGLGIISAGFLLVFKQGSPVSFVLNGVSKLLAGVYFPIAVLPAWLHNFSYCIPLTHSLEAMRGAILNGKDITALANELIILTLFSLVLLPAGMMYFSWAVRKAKRDGSLVLR